MAAGKPIIGAINGSCANFIVNNEIGFSCNSCDSQSLATIIKQFGADQSKQMGSQSKNVYFKKYSKNLFMSKLLNVLKEIKTNNVKNK
jgi:glycosyltransferase involved in cell wall biosynthesis